MNHQEWTARARFDGFDKIEAVRVADGWRLVGLVDNGAHPYPNQRNAPRVFKSLDTLASLADGFGVDFVVKSRHDLGV